MDLTLREIKEIKMDMLEQIEDIVDEKEKEECIKEIDKDINNLILKKSNSIIAVEQEYKNRIDAVEQEIKRLTEYKKHLKSLKEQFEKRIEYNMKELGLKNVLTDLGKISFRKKPLSVEIENVDVLPDEFVRVKVTKEPDKESIKKLYTEKGIKLDNVKYNIDTFKIVIG